MPPFDRVSRIEKPVRLVLESFPEFEPESLSDEGQNGYVMIGLHRGLNIRVAVKAYWCEPDAPHLEPQLLREIESPNVLKVLDARRPAPDVAFFCTPAAEHGTLETSIQEKPSLHAVFGLLTGVLSGLSALHAPNRRLLHRDLKPQNILVHDGVPIIADFGSVRRLQQGESHVVASKHSVVYRPAEAFGLGKYSMQSDLYQVGVVAYQLLGGYLDYTGLSYLSHKENLAFQVARDPFDQTEIVDRAIGRHVVKGTLLDWSTLPPYVPGTLLRVVKRATASNPARRWGTCSEFLGAMSNLRALLPDWRSVGDSLELRDWNGRDFRIICNGGAVLSVQKRIAASPAGPWRNDNALFHSAVADVLRGLSTSYGVPG